MSAITRYKLAGRNKKARRANAPSGFLLFTIQESAPGTCPCFSFCSARDYHLRLAGAGERKDAKVAVAINWYDSRVFKTWNYQYLKEDAGKVITDALALLIGDYDLFSKQAAILILKALVREDFMKLLLDHPNVYPTDRDDARVLRWKRTVLKRGKCESCGSKARLEAHHIIRWADYPQGRIDTKNGRCLCHDCHTNEHRFDQSYYMMKAKH